MDRYRMPIGPVLDVVVTGVSCRKIDRERHKANGWTAKLVRHWLDLHAGLARRRYAAGSR